MLPLHVIWEINQKSIMPRTCHVLCSWEYFNPYKKHKMRLNLSRDAFCATIHVPRGMRVCIK